MIRDQWVRDSLLDMGEISAGRGFFVHLYLNGMYWGVSQPARAARSLTLRGILRRKQRRA